MAISGTDPAPGGPILLDGIRLARGRSAGLAARASDVARRRGTPPRLALIAFAEADGAARHVTRKLRACARVGVDAVPLILPPGVTTHEARGAVAALLDDEPADGVFIQVPFPASVDGNAVTELVPERADVDVMTPGRAQRYLEHGEGAPPLTVAAGCALLDGFGIDITGLDAIVVAAGSPFALMFREALVRSGARRGSIVPPHASDADRRVFAAGLVVVAAGVPGIVGAERLAAGAVAIDAGYYNPDGRGDIDTAGGISHLAAFAPVPGGIGPMTVSLLVERVIELAERASGPSRVREAGPAGDRAQP